MNIQFTHYKNNSLNILEKDIEVENWHQKPTWINIKTNNREEVVEYFKKNNLYGDAENIIKNPVESLATKKLKHGAISNLVISSEKDIYTPEYITFIFDKNLVITIMPIMKTALGYDDIQLSRLNSFISLPEALVFFISSNVLSNNTVNQAIARDRIHKLEDQLINAPEDLDTLELISCERDISRLADIIEDQYIDFGIISSLSIKKNSKESINQYSEFIKGFEPLSKAIARLEQKTENLRLQYLLYQQEKSSRKINVLTIIQAIFVPLTFLAGIYGMNFKYIPELNHPQGYFILWGLFIAIAASLLAYFYKNGWFD